MYEWSVELMRKEKARLKGLGVEPIDLEVVDMSVLVEGNKYSELLEEIGFEKGLKTIS